MSTPENIIVAGCGAMGLPMAQALVAAGFNCHGYDVRPRAEFNEFADRMLDSPCASHPDTLLLVVVRDSTQIDQLCFDVEAVCKQPVIPHTIVISSTVSPRYISTLANRLPASIRLLDAPMSGAPFSAHERSLTFMLGAAAADIADLQPLFDAMGSRSFHLGSVGNGMLAKVYNNYVAATTVAAVRRSMARAGAAGLAPEALLEIMHHSSGATWYGDHFNAIDWASEQHSDDNTIGILVKDVKASLDVFPELQDGFDDALLDALRELPPTPE